MNSSCSDATDSMFGPWAGTSCRGGFDFTLFFEHTVLTIGPAIAFLLASPLRLLYLARQKPVTSANPLRTFKLIAALTFAGIQLGLLCQWAATPVRRNTASTASVSLGFIAALCLIALSWLEDSRSLRPSTLLNAYILLTLLLDIAQARTLWLQRSGVAIPAVFSASMGIKIVLILLESRNKRRFLINKDGLHPPEALSGIINRSFMWWLNQMIQYGYKSLIQPHYLYALDKDLSADNLHQKIVLAWDRRRDPERRFEYLLAVSKILWKPFLQAAIPRLFLIGFTFAQTFLITRAVSLLSANHPEHTANQIGYGLLGATFLIYAGIAISRLLSSHRLYRTITMFRGATVSLIHDRALQIQDGLYDEGASITLMSADTDRVALALNNLNEIWSRLIEVVIAMFLLARQLDWVAVIPLIIVICGFLGGGLICKDIGTNIKVWTDAVQKRIVLTSSVLAETKAMKMMGLSKVLKALVQASRIEELGLMGAFRSNLSWALIFAMSPGIWAPPVAFAVFAIQASVRGMDSINTTQAFTSLSIITLFCEPASVLVQSIVDVFAAVGSSDRIQTFLVSPQRKDQRQSQSSGSESSSWRNVSAKTSAVELEEYSKPLEACRTLNSVAISVDGADIRPDASAPLVLQEIDMTIHRGSIAMVIGLVGSGKTTLIRALIGEISCERGKVYVCSERISLCSQTAWLPNTTIRQAICGPGIADLEIQDEKWYQAVLDACALGPDLDLMEDGDETMLGSASAALSGGQKQRISLARAVYSRASIVILDDVLSALDSRTKKIVVENLLGERGLLKTLESTVLLVTHESKYLHYADQVFALSEGKLKSAATYGELLQDSVPDMIPSACADDAEHVEAKDASDLVPRQRAKRKSLHEDSTFAEADNARATGEWSTYKYYFKSIGWRDGSLCFFMTVFSAFFMSFGSIWLKFWTEDGGGRMAYYIPIYLVIALLATVSLGLQIWSILCLIGPSTGLKLHQVLLDTVMRAPQSYFSSTDSGTILNRFSNDMQLIEGTLPAGMLQTISNIFLVAFSIAFVAMGSSYMALSIPALLVILWILQRVYLRTSRQLRLLDLEAKSPLYSHFLESINGLTTIRAFGWQQQCQDELLRHLDLSQRPYYMMYCVQRWLTLVLDLIVAAQAVLVIGLALNLRSSTSAGLLGVSLNSILDFNKRVRNLIEGWTELETSLGSIARVRDFERDVTPEAKEGEDHEPPVDWPQRGEIEFRNVSASHNSLDVVLHEISFKVGSGQKVGICGRTGSGKSSLIGSLLRLLEIKGGSIFVDDIDLATIPRDTIRERLVAIPQETLILTGSLRLNVDPAKSYSDSSITQALQRTGLWPTFEERGGLDAEITASVLSKGQQQLLALSRAMLRKGKILLLDEPTSNVDAETDAIMQKILREDFGSCTILTVAHRLDSIMDSDIIAVVDAGELVELGPPEELLMRHDGWFSRLAGR